MHFSNPKSIVRICLASLLGVFIMLIVDTFPVNYWIKCLIKLTVFGSGIAIACKPNFMSILKLSMHKSFVWVLSIGIIILGLVIGLTPILLPIFDLEQVQSHLTNVGIAQNYLYVTLYIVFVNSLLEELFFRGMCVLKLQEHSNQTFAITYSAILFATYHIPMMIHIFPMWLVILCFIGLMLVGIFFALLNSKTKNIYNAWIVHAFANIAINYVGYQLL